MGNCCRKLENIDHVEDMDDLIIVVEEDITTYRKNIQIFNSDKVNKIVKDIIDFK